MTAMIEYCGVYVPQLHIGPPTCEERAEAKRLAREAFLHAYPTEQEIARGEATERGDRKHDLEAAQDRAKTIEAQADGKVLAVTASGPVYAPRSNAVPFLAQLTAQESFGGDSTPTAQRAAEASGLYNAVPSSRVLYDGPSIAFDIVAYVADYPFEVARFLLLLENSQRP